jgi:hypothetical protein
LIKFCRCHWMEVVRRQGVEGCACLTRRSLLAALKRQRLRREGKKAWAELTAAAAAAAAVAAANYPHPLSPCGWVTLWVVCRRHRRRSSSSSSGLCPSLLPLPPQPLPFKCSEQRPASHARTPLYSLPPHQLHPMAAAESAQASAPTNPSDALTPAACVSPEAAAALQQALTQATSHFRRVL